MRPSSRISVLAGVLEALGLACATHEPSA